ncbi:prevent-host-death protein [Rhizobium sp. TH135]|uniref:type II toxin-antitoxin system Phd/YefM family antitoxin n=1 Tax=Rhizobium sp. TH135 TaxID=2067451 RepID=UPI000C7A5794|nr:type II toxin-antitoxin system Phd/YefM family antitoxin [Rhizobium sp. TH135]PLK70938.1 prevent-host-death protein [Rhizobium sp. TH135]
MSSVSVANAKVRLASLVDEAATGAFVTITRHGKPAAMLVSIEVGEAAKRAMAKPKPNFGEFLMSYPGPADVGVQTLTSVAFRT